MKKITTFILLAFSVLLVSCSGGSSDGTDAANLSGSSSQLVGKWIYSGNMGDSSTDVHMLMILDADLAIETYILTGENSSEYYTKCVSTYSVSGNKLLTKAADCESGGSIEDAEMTYSIASGKLTLSDADETLTFSKWTGETSSLSLMKQQTVSADERLAPQVSINTNPTPSHVLFIKMP